MYGCMFVAISRYGNYLSAINTNKNNNKNEFILFISQLSTYLYLLGNIQKLTQQNTHPYIYIQKRIHTNIVIRNVTSPQSTIFYLQHIDSQIHIYPHIHTYIHRSRHTFVSTMFRRFQLFCAAFIIQRRHINLQNFLYTTNTSVCPIRQHCFLHFRLFFSSLNFLFVFNFLSHPTQ